MAVEPELAEAPPDRVSLSAVASRLAAAADVPLRLDDLDVHLGDGRGVTTLDERFDVAAGRLGQLGLDGHAVMISAGDTRGDKGRTGARTGMDSEARAA